LDRRRSEVVAGGRARPSGRHSGRGEQERGRHEDGSGDPEATADSTTNSFGTAHVSSDRCSPRSLPGDATSIPEHGRACQVVFGQARRGILHVVRTPRLVATAIVVLVAGASAATSGRAVEEHVGGGPALRIVGKDPLTIAGRRFQARERVRLTIVSAGQKHVVRVRAKADGTFVAGVDGVVLDRCSGPLSARAIGSAGSRASFSLERLHCSDAADVETF
jgi:hypothetical protein